MTSLAWLGIAVCVLHSAIFSGLNLAVFGLSRLRLEVESEAGDKAARRILGLRRDANFLLTTILWGNVSANVLLALLSDSLLTGFQAFLFSTIIITFIGEILPQAYFSRHALRVGSALAPVLRFYQWVLYPLAKPTALLLDLWLGQEVATYLRERDLRKLIEMHMTAEHADLHPREGIGALNFLALDDLPVSEEGEPVHPDSIIPLPTLLDLPQLPEFSRDPSDPFLQQLHRSGRKWVILTDSRTSEPLLVLDTDAFLRAALLEGEPFQSYAYCHRPLIVREASMPIGEVLRRLEVRPEHVGDDVIDRDLILYWGQKDRRVVTGADLLGRLLRGIAGRSTEPSCRHPEEPRGQA